MCALNPAFETGFTPKGIPDRFTGTVVTNRFIGTFGLGMPAWTEGETVTAWSVILFIPPTPDTFGYAFAQPVAQASIAAVQVGSGTSALYYTPWNDIFHPLPSEGTGGPHAAGKWYRATNYSDNGGTETFVMNLFPSALGPSYVIGASATSTAPPLPDTVNNQVQGLARASRLMGKSFTVHLNAAALNNQGIVTSGQFALDSKNITLDINNHTKPPGSADNTTIAPTYMTMWDEPCADAQDLLQADPKAVQVNAYDGTYVPLRIAQDSIPMVPIESYGQLFVNANPFGPTSFAAASWPARAGILANNAHYCGMMCFDGISPTASLQVKPVMHVEWEVDTFGAWAPFSHPSPLANFSVTECVAVMEQELPHAFLAADNDLGNIGGIIKTVGNTVSGLGIPIISDIARLVGGLFG